MNTDEFVEDYFIKLFSKYKGFRKKPKISGVSIILENVPYDNKKVNSPDFLCVLKSREVIFEIFNASELFSMNSEIKFQPGKTIMYGITKQIFNKVVEKINENFNNITLQFRHPIILLINTDKSDIDPLNTVLMINSSNKLSENVLQNVKKKELISAVILTKIKTKTAILFSTPFANHRLNNEELRELGDVFEKVPFNFSYQIDEHKTAIN